MSTIVDPARKTMTLEEFLALPDDGVHRELIRGEVREYPDPEESGQLKMTIRNPFHSEAETCLAQVLKNWLDRQPKPRGKIVSGEAAFRLKRNDATLVGIDVAYASPEVAATRDRRKRYLDGPPVLAVEILSPSDDHASIVEKVDLYLEVGTVVWVVDPDFRTVAVHQPGEPVQTYNDRQELSGDPYLPGFRVPVVRLFDGD